MRVSFLRFLSLAFCLPILSACVSGMLARQVVTAPNKTNIRPLFADSALVKHGPDAFTAQWTVRIDEPGADIAVATIEPGDWADADIAAALRRTRAPVLFVHGEADTWLSPDHSRTLLRSAPAGSELVVVPRDNHVSLPLQVRTFEQPVLEWFAVGLGVPRPAVREFQ